MRMRATKLLSLLTVAASLIISGCIGAREPDGVAFVLAIGIDAAEDKKVLVSYQIGRPAGASDSGSSDRQGQALGSEIVTIKAASLAEARNLLNAIVAPSANLSHAKILVVGEELARRGLRDILAPIMRFREFRGSMFVVVAQGSACEFLRANKSSFVITPAKYYELMMETSAESRYYFGTQLHDFYYRMKSFTAVPYAGYAALSAGTVGIKGGRKLPGTKIEELTAGQIARQGGNPLEFAGTAVFRGDKMVGVLTNHETQGLAILIGDFPSGGFFTIEDPLAPETGVNVNVGLEEKPKITARLENGRAVFDIQVKLQGEISAIPSGINYEQAEYCRLLEQHTANLYKEVIESYLRVTQELNCDAAGLGFYLRTRFGTRQEFSAFNWNDRYREAEARVNVTVKLRRAGLMWQTRPIVGQ